MEEFEVESDLLEEFDHDELTDHCLEEVFEEFESSEIDGIPLQSVDYNLNSPLIEDSVHYALNYLNNINRRYESQQNDEELDEIFKALFEFRVPIRDLKEPCKHHHFIPDLIYNNDPKLLRLDIVKRWEEIWDMTKDPVNVTQNVISGDKKDKILMRYKSKLTKLEKKVGDHKETRLQSEWRSFSLFHYIIYLMNSKAFSENKKWCKFVFTKINNKELDPNLITVLGTRNDKKPFWLVTDNYVYNFKTKCLFHKNFCLMLKDIALARVMSKLSVLDRENDPGEGRTFNVLESLYIAGDKILKRAGNKGYKHLKLLEAHCLEQWNVLGHQFRPLIPLSTSMDKHLTTQLNKDPAMSQISHEFFRVIKEEFNPWIVGQIYGTFRHFGHPYIDYLKGLENLERRCNSLIHIDQTYANKLASDLTYLVLRDQFNRHKKWFATSEGLPEKSPMKLCIDNGVWPNTKVIEDFGDNWHNLVLLKCFEIPDSIDLTDLYSDKAHSMQRSEVIKHVRERPNRTIPARRVIGTLLERDSVDIKAFLQKINDHGLDLEDLVIGLKAKERELKDEGRFFSLMSWNIRLYFVITEYLIKLHFVPLFSGLTVADDQNTVTKKLLNATEGQGLNSYEKVYIANSLDYEKWNNRQRYESNEPVFTVMGKFLGYPKLISYTHLCFQNCLIYYNERPDLMIVRNNSLENRDPTKKVCWNGQFGGFEGIRQKGWSILNYLILRREAMTRNTATKFLAQGDNQIVITQYTLVSRGSEDIIRRELKNIWNNNSEIMRRIQAATGRIGLVINDDEVLTSAELLVYGKIPVFRGKLIPLETKRWSRVSTVTNEQIPSFSNSLASSTTTALAVNQHSEDPLEVIRQHHFFSSFAATIITFVNPIIGCDPISYDNLSSLKKKEFFVRLIYKDPSVGGVCGTNLLRFFISRFPDPLCETLTWWKILYNNSTDPVTREIAKECGNPRYGSKNIHTLNMLLEDPMTLNIPGGLSSDTMIKNKIYKGLLNHLHRGLIKNSLIKESLVYSDKFKEPFILWLFKIKPVFPRFLSEFYSSTYFHITESILSIFQNSRTIRKVFSKRFPKEVYDVIKKGELMSIRSLLFNRKGLLTNSMWKCSASKADDMRKLSWGPDLIGVTTPHPAEFLYEINCQSGCSTPHVVSKKVPVRDRSIWTKGTMMPYLGSKTKESTSINQPWEKRVEIPLLRRACDLRKAIRWFVEPDSNLGITIYQNLESMTGLDLKEELYNYKRTGSSRHRLRCSRVSNEGNPGISYNNLSYVTVTTDSLGEINSENYDFMYQTVLCWSGVIATLPGNKLEQSETTHFHISCEDCFRTIGEDYLEAPYPFKFLDVSNSIRRMLTTDIKLKYLPRLSYAKTTEWESLEIESRSWHIGRAQGFLWGVNVFNKTEHEIVSDIFPTSITRKVSPLDYMEGLHRGFCLAATLLPMYKRYGSLSEKARLKFEGSYWDIVWKALSMTNLPNMINHKQFQPFLKRRGGDLIKSYPATKDELVLVLRKWFLHMLITERKYPDVWKTINVVSFADMDTEYMNGLFRLSEKILPCYQHNMLSGNQARILGHAKNFIELLSRYNNSLIEPNELDQLKMYLGSPDLPMLVVVNSQARHAAGDLPDYSVSDMYPELSSEYQEFEGFGGFKIHAEYQPQETIDWENSMINQYVVPRIRNTLMSSCRIVQYSTGAHYKYKDLSFDFPVSGDGIFCGDGSGGMGANHLRKNKNARVIFNSKLDLKGESMKGLAPSGPGAYTVSGDDVVQRCVNHTTCWEEPSDLSERSTWENFKKLIREHKLKIEVFCCDAEVIEEEMTDNIEKLILEYLNDIFYSKKSTFIYKTYFNRLLLKKSIVHSLGMYFQSVYLHMPHSQGSFTSEVYIVGINRKSLNTPSRTELTLDTFNCLYNNIRVMRTYEEEFKRAQYFDYDLIVKGLENKIPFIKVEEIAIFLTTLGLDTGIALMMSEQLEISCNKGLHPIIIMWIIGYVISRHVICVHSWYKQGVRFPSSMKLQKMLAGLFGIWFGIVKLLNDPIGFINVSQMYQGELTVSVGVSKPVYKKKGNKLLGQYMSWRLSHGKNMKTVDIGPKAGITQQMTRLLFVLYKGKFTNRDVSKEDVVEGDRILSFFGKGINIKTLERRTGINYTNLGVKNDMEIDEVLVEEPNELNIEDLEMDQFEED